MVYRKKPRMAQLNLPGFFRISRGAEKICNELTRIYTNYGMVQKPGNLLYNSRLQQMEKVTDLLDRAHLFLPKSVVIIVKMKSSILNRAQITKN